MTGSNQKLVDAQLMMEMQRRLELLETMHVEASGTDEKVERLMALHLQAEEDNKKLRKRLRKSRSGSSTLSHGTGSTLSLGTPEWS